jgi:hypothetical protein
VVSRFARGNTDLVSNRSTSARATRTGLHKDPVSREHHPNSQVSDVTEFPAPTGSAAVDLSADLCDGLSGAAARSRQLCTPPKRDRYRIPQGARSVRGLDSVFGVPVLDGFARWRNTIFSACIGFSEDLFRLRRGIVAPSFPLLRQESVGSALHSLWVGFVTHGYWSTRLRQNRCAHATGRPGSRSG